MLNVQHKGIIMAVIIGTCGVQKLLVHNRLVESASPVERTSHCVMCTPASQLSLGEISMRVLYHRHAIYSVGCT